MPQNNSGVEVFSPPWRIAILRYRRTPGKKPVIWHDECTVKACMAPYGIASAAVLAAVT